jgi:hypothetical protein
MIASPVADDCKPLHLVLFEKSEAQHIAAIERVLAL